MTRKFTFLMTAMALIFAMMTPRGAWGQTESVTYVFNSKDWKAKIGETNANWTSKKDGSQFTQNQGIQVTTGATGACGNSNVAYSNVSKIVVTYCTNASKGAGSINWYNVEATTSAAQSGTLAGSYTVTKPSSGGTTLRTCEIIPSSAQTGFVQLYVECDANSIYIWSVEIQYTSGPSTTPACTIDPTEWDFGNVEIGEQTQKTFTVTTANLTEDLTLTVSEGFSVSPATIESTETGTTVTVTCAPTAVGALYGTLTISGGGLTDDVTATLSATGIGSEQYTITYSAANGTAPEAQQVTQGSTVTLPTINDVDCNTWQFAGWSESENSTEAPALMAGDEYTPENDVTLYAVYKKQTGSGTTDYTLQYDTWTYSGTTTDKSSYRLFGDGAYIESAESHDLSNVTAVKITMRTFGGTGYKNVNIEDASGNVWGNAAATGTTLTEITATKTNGLTGNGKLRIKSKSGNGTDKGVGISKVVYTVNNTSYTYSTDPDCSTPVATPTITPNGGEFIGSQEITLACTTEGATISYTTDDWETPNTYSAPFTITATTTLKVKATKEGMSESETVSATFTKIQALETIQAIFDASATAGNYYVTFNNWVVSGVKGPNAYVTDGTKGFIVYTSGHGFEAGDVISGTAQLALTRYNGAAEFTNLTSTTEGISVRTGGTITPTEVSIADLSGVNTGAVIKVNNVQYNGTNLVDENSNIIKPYNAVDYNPTFTNGLKYNVTGVYIQFNTTKEIAPRSATDIQLIVAAPTFTPEGGAYNAAQNVEITSATSGAEIYYTTDGSDPTVESTLYSAPIELTSNTTLKAIAAKAGSVSEIATAVYTITITTVATPTFEPEDGSYFNESLEVSLDCATDGATIVYTTDNWSTQNNYTAPFTITKTTTVKAKATKAAMDDSEIAEATYTKRYKVDYVVNGNATAVAAVYVTPGEAIGTLPTATAPNGYTFRGWNAGDVALTDVEPTYVTAETIPTGNMTLKAVFAIAEEGGENALVKMVAGNTLNNGDKIVIVAHETTVALYQETVSSSYVNIYTFDNNFATIMGDDKNWLTVSTAEGGFTLGDATNGYLYSSGNNLYIGETAQTWTLSDLADGTFKIQSGERNLSYRDDLSNKYWRMGGASYGTSGQTILDIYKVSASSVVYTNFCTSVTALSGNLAEAMTEAGNAYYISTAAYVPANATVTINGVLTNTNAANLIIEDGGQLIHTNDLAATVQENVSEWTETGGWYLIASPVDGHDIESIIGATGTYDLFLYNEPTAQWCSHDGEVSSFTTLSRGSGYLYANETNRQLDFAGLMIGTATEVTKTLSRKCTYNDDNVVGYNLLGNPYTRNLKLGDITVNDNIWTSFLLLNNDEEYEVCNMANGDQIKPGQGFFIQAESDGQTLKFKQASSKDGSEIGLISIVAGNENKTDKAFIQIGGGNTLRKIAFTNSSSVYVMNHGDDYAAARVEELAGTMPVHFDAVEDGEYTITINAKNIEAHSMHLIDNFTGEVIDLLVNSSYTFIANESDDPARFRLAFDFNDYTGVNESYVNGSFAYQNGDELIVNGDGTLQVFDVMGRYVGSYEVHGSERISVSAYNTGVYMLRFVGENVMTQKIVVR